MWDNGRKHKTPSILLSSDLGIDVRLSVPYEQTGLEGCDTPSYNVSLSAPAKCSFSPLCHHSYNTSVVIATDKLVVYYTLFIMVWTTKQVCSLMLPLGCMCVYVCAITSLTYLIFKLIPFQALWPSHTYLSTCNSSQGVIFQSRPISLGESQ